MSARWTPQQIMSLAPDASSDKAARDLANLRKWARLGCNEDSAWGQCQGSGAKPYQAQIDLSEPAFKCSCPSRKFPCKHSLALFLLLATEPNAFTQGGAPDWVAEWLTSRRARAEQRATQAEKRAEKASDPEAQARRSASRESKVAAGVQELERWLSDAMRTGLAGLQTQPYSFWSGMAARMVDAQAPGIARTIKDMADIVNSGVGWQSRLLRSLSRLHLLLEAYNRLDGLSADLQMDVRAAIGWTQDQEELLSRQGLRDRWAVVAQQVYEEDRLRVQRTWLWGRSSCRPALILNFSHQSQPMADAGLAPGSVIDAEIVFFPGAYPLRALVKEKSVVQDAPGVSGYACIDDACAAFASALAVNPCMSNFPVLLDAVVPQRLGEHWVVRDSSGDSLALSPRFGRAWEFLSISGGYELAVMGEWDGDYLLPLSAWTADRFHPLANAGNGG